MKHESKRKWLSSSLFALLVAALLTPAMAAQEPPKKPEVAPPASAAKEVKKLRGRLPAYYGKVVSNKQRDQIYKIQAKFNEQIVKLKEQLDSLTGQRDTEVEQVLTDEQRTEVAKLKGSRKSRQAKSTEESATAGSQ